MEEMIPEKESIELIKSYITRRAEVAEYVIRAVNAEIDHRRECASHFRLRKSLLSDKHITRLLRIVKEVLSGRYHRYSNGIRSAAGDLLAFR